MLKRLKALAGGPRRIAAVGGRSAALQDHLPRRAQIRSWGVAGTGWNCRVIRMRWPAGSHMPPRVGGDLMSHYGLSWS